LVTALGFKAGIGPMMLRAIIWISPGAAFGVNTNPALRKGRIDLTRQAIAGAPGAVILG